MEHCYESLFRYIQQFTDMPQQDKDSCRRTFHVVEAKKDTMLETAGKIPVYHNFIVSGFMRKFHINDKGEEVTVDLNNGPRFFTSYFHFAHQTVSDEYLHCITDCELLRIHKSDADKTAKTSISQKDFTIQLFQQVMDEDKQRMTDLATLTAEQRYLKFMKACPHIIKNVPQKYIASYLGIKPESLSRIRRDIIS